MEQPHARRQFTRRRFLALTGGGAVAAATIRPGAAAAAAARERPDAASDRRDYVRLVDPFIATEASRWFFFQSASSPFGFVKLRPDTDNATQWNSGYHPGQPDVKGFSHLHDWQIAGVQVMPVSGAPVVKTEGESGWQSPRAHAHEIAQPGYHRLHLDRYGITAELTNTERVGFHRYTYHRAAPGEIIINLGGVLGEAVMMNAEVTRVSNSEIEGHVVQHGTFSSLPYPNTLYFSIRFDRPFDSLHGWADGSLANRGRPIRKLAGNNMGVYARYRHLSAGTVVQLKVALSFTGTDGARNNLRAEMPGWDFGAVRDATQDHWNALFGRIDVHGGTHRQRVKFYTDLFHALCGRSMISDADGRYHDGTWGTSQVRQIPLDKRGRPKFAMYNHDALWLTQWNLNSILGLAYPEIYSSLVQCHLQIYKNGGLLSRGPVAGNYSFIMTGSPVTSLICGAWNKGIRDFDPHMAFAAMLDAHSVGGLFDKAENEYGTWTGNGGIRHYLDLGYVPADVSARSAGLTMEYAYQDWTLAQFARQLRKKGLNICQFADVRVSSQLNDSNYAGVRAVDGRPMRSSISPPHNVEWVSAGERTPWITLTWDRPRTIHKVALSDRADPDSNVNSGVLTFSDGSAIPVDDVPVSGRHRAVEFEPKSVTWVRFHATGGTGTNVGLNEIEVWDDTDLYTYLRQRSRNWRNLFDAATGFIRPKHSDGTWAEPFDPLQGGFVESNAWQEGFFTAQDVMGLANLMHDPSTYAHKLNYAFTLSAPHAFSGEYPYNFVNYGNQPGLEQAHLFSYVGYPWLTQHWVRQVHRKAFGGTSATSGYTGDEDQGQMGSLSALMAMGLFEVTGGGLAQPVYDITSPIFDEITITLHPRYHRGRKFRITTRGNSAASLYIRKAELNGHCHDNAWLHHDRIAAGGTLELWLSDKPSRKWGTSQLPPSDSAPNGQRPVLAREITIAGPSVVTAPTVSYAAVFTPASTSLKLPFWSVTEPDGSATDKAAIDPSGVLTVRKFTGEIVVTATAADEGKVSSRKRVSLDVPGVSRLTGPH